MTQSKFYTLIHEPLVHFLIIGAGIFFLFNLISEPETELEQQIVIQQVDLDKLAIDWLRRNGRPASEQEREQQLKHFIREQVLYREAMTMGLDKDDAIVRRRLAQKMNYLFDDLSVISEPTEIDLETFLSGHTDNFIVSATISFSQIYFDPTVHKSPEKRQYEAEKLLKQLESSRGEIDTINLGDRSLLPYEFTAERKSEISSMFGLDFTQKIFTLALNTWQGPVHSEYGSHLIYIHSRTQVRLPPLIEIREQVIRQWKAAKRREANDIFYQSLLQRYKITLDVAVKNKGELSSQQ